MVEEVHARTAVDVTELVREEGFYLLLNVTAAAQPAAKFIKNALLKRAGIKPR